MFDPDEYENYTPKQTQPHQTGGKPKSHLPYVASPKPKKPDPSMVAGQFSKMKSDNRIIRRSVMLPGESYQDYIDKFRSSGMKREEFDKRRLFKNGWTDSDEKIVQTHKDNLLRIKHITNC